tara:strand:+ start:63 stop:389 length:327 start_codon:yes stop_codon:yes gene_type:complete
MQQTSGQDWEPVIFNNTNSNYKKQENENNEKKYGDDETKKKPISLINSKLIQQVRMTKKMTQQQLAQKINKDQKTIQLYESGKTAPEYAVMCKIEKVLGIKLNKKKSQ